MKTLLYLCAVFAVLSCGPSPLQEKYQVQLPPSPAFRAELLGEPLWRLEWYDPAGNLRQREMAGSTNFVGGSGASGSGSAGSGGSGSISILAEWPSAVLAWPYWPDKELAPGLFCPAGAIFPLDVSGDRIILSWEAGAEGYFYRELDKARGLNTTNRVPEFFDWKRFRTLLRKEAPDEIRLDPWLADWKSIAERTVRSGFRSSYVRADTRTDMDIIIPHAGPWLGASPFRPAESWGAGEEISLLLTPRPEIFVCPGGMLSVSAYTWLWTPFP